MSTSYDQRVLRTQSSSFVGYWPLNEESGTVAYDLSPNGNNATSVSLVRTSAGRSFLAPDGSKCAQFDGTNSYINLYGAVSDASSAEGSISVWAATPTANLGDTTKMYISGFRYDGSNYIDLSYYTTANLVKAEYSAAATYDAVDSPLIYNVDGGPQLPEWHHFVFTYSKTNDAINLYVDGVIQTEATGLGTFAGAFASTTMTLGSSSTTAADQLKGWLAKFAWWTAILTQTEVDGLYKIGL